MQKNPQKTPKFLPAFLGFLRWHRPYTFVNDTFYGRQMAQLCNDMMILLCCFARQVKELSLLGGKHSACDDKEVQLG